MASADNMSPSRMARQGTHAAPRRDRHHISYRADRYRPARSRSPRRERGSAASLLTPAAPAKTKERKQAEAKAEYEKLLSVRSGGVYMPPARLRVLQAQITDKTTRVYQRMAWEALKKSINGLINKVNYGNIKHIVPELFGENLIRGRGLFCQSIIKAQNVSLPFTPIYAALVAITNTKLPNVGELLVKRLVLRFRKAFRRNDKAVCISATSFLAHLTNTRVCHEMLCAQILLLLLQKPTDDSVEIAVGLTKEVGQFLEEANAAIAMAVFDQFRTILNEAELDRRTEYMIEVLFQIRKDKYRTHPIIKDELDLVEEEDQITHRVLLDGEMDIQDSLNIFKLDPDYEANEEEYRKLKADILGEASDDDDADDDDDDDDSGSESEDEEQKMIEIKDRSNADLVNLRRTIYLTLMSSSSPEESVHKLMKLKLPQGQEPELVSMIIESCSQEKTYLKFYGLVAERFAKLNRMWMDLYQESFAQYYETIHRCETNKLRNIARLFGHLLSTDAIAWHCLGAIHLNEEETTAASRIFIKILFEDIQENLGQKKLAERMRDEMLQPSLEGLFPYDDARNTRFAINYFTAIKMGYLTEEMRTFLQNAKKPALPAPATADHSETDSVSSYSSYTGSSYSTRSRSRTPRQRATDRGRSMSRTPPRRDRSYSSPNRDRSRARSVPRGRSVSRWAPPCRGDQRRGVSRSTSPYSTRRRSSSPWHSPSRSPSPPRRGRGRAVRTPSDDLRSPRGRPRRTSPFSEASDAAPSKRGARKAPSYNSCSPSRSPWPRAKRKRGERDSNSSRSSSPRGGSGTRSPSRSSRSPPSRRGGRYSSRDSFTPTPPPTKARRDGSYSRSPSRSIPPSLRPRRAPDGPNSGAKRDGSSSPWPPRERGTLSARRDDSLGRDRDRRRERKSRPPSAGGGAGGAKRRRRYRSSSRSRSRLPAPPPVKRGRRDDERHT